jgi:hypothetical protein
VKAFIPQTLPRDDLDWAELVPLIARANGAIARYDGIVHGLINPTVLLSRRPFGPWMLWIIHESKQKL